MIGGEDGEHGQGMPGGWTAPEDHLITAVVHSVALGTFPAGLACRSVSSASIQMSSFQNKWNAFMSKGCQLTMDIVSLRVWGMLGCCMNTPPGVSIWINLCFLKHYDGNSVNVTSYQSILTRAMIYRALNVWLILYWVLYLGCLIQF